MRSALALTPDFPKEKLMWRGQAMMAVTMIDANTFSRVMHEHLNGVWAYLRFLGCDAATADDLAQETFLVLMRKGLKEENRSATAAYLRTTARYLYLTARRTGKRRDAALRVEVTDQVWVEWVEEGGGLDDWLEALKQCREYLDERSRQALVLRFDKGVSGEDIARQLAITPDNVNNILHRAKQQLKQCIEKRIVS